jgi:hypothetical protein
LSSCGFFFFYSSLQPINASLEVLALMRELRLQVF